MTEGRECGSGRVVRSPHFNGETGHRWPRQPRLPVTNFNVTLFDKHIASQCAALVRGLYDGTIPPTINDRSTDTQVLVARQDGIAFVVFPGTASYRDAITDVRFKFTEWQDGVKVHRGFRFAYESIANALRAQIADESRVIFCGHSLGGALATLAADDLFFAKSQGGALPQRDGVHTPLTSITDIVSAVYTFGSPRVGNIAFARRYDASLHDKTFRIVNEGDPVVRVPWLFGLYRHVGTRVFLSDRNGIEVNPPLWRGLIPTTPAGESREFIRFSPHSIQSYQKKLNA